MKNKKEANYLAVRLSTDYWEKRFFCTLDSSSSGPSKLSAITSNLLSERMLSSKNDSIVSLSVWKNIYGNTNRHLAIRACNIRETSKRTLDLYFLFFPAQCVEIIVCVPFWHK